MGRFGRWMLLASLFLILTNGVRAQEGVRLKSFLADDSPALLFQINQLSLERWNGGVGMMFSASENLHWRFSISPKISNSGNTTSDTAYGELTNSTSRTGISVTGGPMWVLYRNGEFCFTAGGELSYSYEHLNEERGVGELSPSTTASNYIGFSANFGAGFVPAEGLLLHAEYLLGGQYGFSSNSTEGTTRTHETTSLWVGVSARLTLIVRL